MLKIYVSSRKMKTDCFGNHFSCLLSRCHILSLVMTHVIYVVLKPWNNHANVITENELLLLSLISMCGLTFSSHIDLYLRIQRDTVLKGLINRDISYHYACTAAVATFNLFTRVCSRVGLSYISLWLSSRAQIHD